MSWPVGSDLITSADWHQLQKVTQASNVNRLQVNDNILVRLQDGFPYDVEFLSPAATKPRTVLELLSISSGLSSDYLLRHAHGTLKPTLGWFIHDTRSVYGGKMIIGLIFPEYNPLKCDRFMWSPLFPEKYVWYYMDSIPLNSIVSINVHTDELFSIGKYEHGTDAWLFRSYDGLQLNLLNRKTQERIWFDPEFVFVSTQFRVWYDVKEQEEQEECELVTFDLPSMVDKQRYQKDHFPIFFTSMKDPCLDDLDQHQVSSFLHYGQEFYFHYQFSNHSHLTFFDSQGQLKKAWHYAALILGPLSSRILLKRFCPPVVDIEEDQTFQHRPGDYPYALDTKVRQLEGWEFNVNLQWICKWRTKIETELHYIRDFAWINQHFVAVVRRPAGIDILDFESGACIHTISSLGFVLGIATRRRTQNKYLSDLLHFSIHRELSTFLLSSLTFIVIAYIQS